MLFSDEKKWNLCNMLIYNGLYGSLPCFFSSKKIMEKGIKALFALFALSCTAFVFLWLLPIALA